MNLINRFSQTAASGFLSGFTSRVTSCLTTSLIVIGFLPGLAISGSSETAVGSRLIAEYQTADGIRYRTEQVSAAAAQSAISSLRNSSRKRPVAARVDSVAGWHLASQVQDNGLIVWQSPPGNGHQRGGGDQTGNVNRASLRTVITPPENRSGAGSKLAPSWWPDLASPWVSRAGNVNSATTTLLGWLPGDVNRVSRVIEQAAERGAMRLLRRKVRFDPNTRLKSGRPDQPEPRGDWLFFVGTGTEMMVTLVPQGLRTGVVAYFQHKHP